MDSPLLPQFKGNADLDTTNLLSDMSLSDPLSPSDSMRHTGTMPVGKSAASASKIKQSAVNDDDTSTDRTTSATGSSKPRFSFFPRNDAQGHEGASGSNQHQASLTRSRSISPVKEAQENGSSGQRAASPQRQGRGGEFPDDDVRRDDDGDIEPVKQAPVRRSSRMGNAERDERLRESLYELREMNKVFDGFLGALEAARGHNLVRFQVTESRNLSIK